MKKFLFSITLLIAFTIGGKGQNYSLSVVGGGGHKIGGGQLTTNAYKVLPFHAQLTEGAILIRGGNFIGGHNMVGGGGNRIGGGAGRRIGGGSHLVGGSHWVGGGQLVDGGHLLVLLT